MVQGKFSLSGPFGIALIIFFGILLLIGAMWMAFSTTGRVSDQLQPQHEQAPEDEFDFVPDWY